MDATITVKKLTEWKPCLSRPVGRPRLRWFEQVGLKEDESEKLEREV
jgi:hypothetical protein